MKTLDGSQGEGGGAILRLAAALALVIQEPVKIISIRKKRSKPGLMTQHLMGLRALAEFCGGNLEGDHLGSETIILYPSNDWKDHLKIQVSTAGSLGLILQSLQVAILAIKNHTLEVEFEGGATFGKWAPSIPYIHFVTWNVFRQMNCKFELKINRHGFYPKGGANVSVSMTSPSKIQGLNLVDFNFPKKAKIISYASQHLQRAQVAERQSNTIAMALNKVNIDPEVLNESISTNNPGSGILVFSRTGNNVIGGDFVGERKLRAEEVGKKAFDRYITTVKSQCTVDQFLADQILPIMSLASTSSVFYTPYLSNHTKTNIALIRELLGVEIQSINLNSKFKINVEI